MGALLSVCEELMENDTGDRKSSESEKHFIAVLNGPGVGFPPKASGGGGVTGRHNTAAEFKGSVATSCGPFM